MEGSGVVNLSCPQILFTKDERSAVYLPEYLKRYKIEIIINACVLCALSRSLGTHKHHESEARRRGLKIKWSTPIVLTKMGLSSSTLGIHYSLTGLVKGHYVEMVSWTGLII